MIGTNIACKYEYNCNYMRQTDNNAEYENKQFLLLHD